MPGEEIQTLIVVGMDITSYALKNIRQQRAAQGHVDRCLQEANRIARPGKALPAWLDAGDGGYALFDCSELTVLNLLTDFYALLARTNEDLAPENLVVVRTALHIGQVISWTTDLGAKYTSHAINDCARLLSGMNRKNGNQVVCSGEFFRKLNTLDEVVKSVRLRDVKDKHGGNHEVWNIRREPGFGVQPEDSEKHQHPLKR
jgi:hypothetical protein